MNIEDKIGLTRENLKSLTIPIQRANILQNIIETYFNYLQKQFYGYTLGVVNISHLIGKKLQHHEDIGSI